MQNLRKGTQSPYIRRFGTIKIAATPNGIAAIPYCFSLFLFNAFSILTDTKGRQG